MYYLDPIHSDVLYGNATARAPVPARLYTESLAGIGAPIGAVKKWTPNVRLVDAKLYRAHILSGFDEERDDFTVASHALSAYRIRQATELNFQSYSPAIGVRLRERLHGDFVPAIHANLRNAGDLGLIAPNDCARFAAVIKNLIGTEEGIYRGGAVTRVVNSRMACFSPALEIGGSVILKFPGGGRHGITAVALNYGFGPAHQIVTLEAHASRYLTRPQFHIYDASSMDDLLMTWYTGADVGLAASTVSFICARPGPGELDQSTTKAPMLAAGVQLEELVGRTFRGGPKTNKAIWDLVGSAGGVPCLLSA